ncbi:MAG: InlB B-repeat-containing protein [Treponema sp.]|nr:InlB B-repeat-containing protein [Treponema sp.]MCL2272969.1 InlB B-repeat-containing protein [Treponema sp.]
MRIINKNVIFLLTLFGVLFTACYNPIMEKWWVGLSESVKEIPKGGGGAVGGSGDNFGYVIFNTDGGTPQPKGIKIAWNGKVGRLRPITRGTDGFLGWFDEKGDLWNVETRPVTRGDDIDGDGFITLTVRWIKYTPAAPAEPPSPSSPVFIVKFEPYSGVSPLPGNAVTIPDQYIASGGKVVQPVAPPTLPVPDSRGFAGWFTEAAYAHRWNFDLPVSANVTLYARWDDDTRLVRFEANGGTRPDGLTDLTHEFTVSLSHGLVQDPGPLVKEGYSFGGWYYEPLFNTVQWNFATKKITDSDVPQTNPLILYAKWIQNKYIVNFVITPSDNDPPATQTVPHGSTVTKPADPAQLGDGQGFDGWYTEESLNNEWDFVYNTVTSSMTLYAKFTPQTRTVHFQVNGGTTAGGMDFLPNRTISISNGRILDPGTLVRAGYSFGGWYTDPECTRSWNFTTDRVVQPDEIIGMDPMYLYAKWTPNRYNVTFNPNGGTPAPAAQSIAHGERVERPIIPVNTGKALVGWYTDDENIMWDFNNNKVFSAVILTAKWENVAYTVTFDLRDPPGGIPSNYTAPAAQSVLNGGKAIEPFMPMSADAGKYSFYCWSNSINGDSPGTVTAWNFDTPITDNVTLYARWVEPAPDMIWVPRGSFTMGDSGVSGSPAAYHSYPTRRVTVDGFYIGRYEVTQVSRQDTNKSYFDVMGINPSQFYRNDVRPVDRVSWFDAVEYCNKLTVIEMSASHQVYSISGKTLGPNLAGTGGVRPAAQSIISASVAADFSRRGYRLPTEAEWEYAARGGNNSPGNFTYSGSDNPANVAWYNETIKQGADAGSTQTVGTKQPNALGIYDMSGNITEWVWDWFASYKDSYYSTAPAGNNPQGPGFGTERIRRGGGWSNAVGNVRSVVRNSQAPGDATWVNGFRVVRGPSAIW